MSDARLCEFHASIAIFDEIGGNVLCVMHCVIWYHLNNFKKVENTQGGVLLLVMLQAKSLQLY